MKVANRLRIVRADKRVTQEALEAKLKRYKISQTRISQIDNELVAATETEKKQIARALKVPVHEVFPEQQVTA